MADPQTTGTGMARPADENIGRFKGQPWIIFDTVAGPNFTIGGDGTAASNALGTQGPPINAAGEMIFFNAPGRSKANFPWLTNMDVNGQLAYGFEVWAIGIEIKVPLIASTTNTSNGPPYDATITSPVAQSNKLADALLQYSVVTMDLGQEEQSSWPLTAFGNGGGVWSWAAVQNSEPEISCTLKLPEAIYMGRTQNISAKLKIAPFMFPTFGTTTAFGVGSPIAPYSFIPFGSTVTTVPQPPFGVQMKLIGRRVKDTQYGASPT